MALGRVIRCLDRQGHVVDLFFAGLVTLRIRALVRGYFLRDLVSQFGRQGRTGLRDRGVRVLQEEITVLHFRKLVATW